MNVFIISQGQDIGGQSARIAAAFKKHTDWNVRAMHVGETYIKYPTDLSWDIHRARELYAQADVVHIQNYLYSYAMLDGAQCKPTIVHHHGPPLRSDADAVNREAASVNAVQIVSTVDLLQQCKRATWVPNFYDLDALAKYHRRPNGRLRIGHAPTVRGVKGTDAILAALNRLAKRYEFDLDLLEGKPWITSLKHKGACDIYIDQVTLGYGLSAIEAMAMGVPVVSGWADPQHRALFERETGQQVPFMHAAAEDLEGKLESLIRSRSLRAEIGDRGQKFVRAWHGEADGVKRLTKIYENAPRTRGLKKLELSGAVKKQDVIRRWAIA